MAKFVVTDPVIVLNAGTVTTSAASVTINVETDDIETTAFGGSGWRTRVGGLKQGTVDIEFHQDMASGAIDSVVWPLLGGTAAMKVRPGGTAPATAEHVAAELQASFAARDSSRPDPNVPTPRQEANLVTRKELMDVLSKRRNRLRRDGVLSGAGTLPAALYEELRMWVAGSLYLADPMNLPRRLEYRSVRVIAEKEWKALDRKSVV